MIALLGIWYFFEYECQRVINTYANDATCTAFDRG